MGIEPVSFTLFDGVLELKWKMISIEDLRRVKLQTQLHAAQLHKSPDALLLL